MSAESINKVLKDFGLTEKEAEIYIFLAKHGTLKGGELVTHTKTHRGLVYRILKSFQTKGLVETSAETPVRFTAIPFERILDANIKAKREEAEQIEKAREHLLEDWRHIQQTELEPPLQRFAVIEGRNRIYSKIIQMIKDTKDQLSVVTTISGLVRVDQLGILDESRPGSEQLSVVVKVMNPDLESIVNEFGSQLGRDAIGALWYKVER